jgi:hypothetical protein
MSTGNTNWLRDRVAFPRQSWLTELNFTQPGLCKVKSAGFFAFIRKSVFVIQTISNYPTVDYIFVNLDY